MVAPVQFLVKQETKLSVEVKEKREFKETQGLRRAEVPSCWNGCVIRDT